MAYWWESELSIITGLFGDKVNASPGEVSKYTREAVVEITKLLARVLGIDLDEEKVPEAGYFFMRSVVVMNSLMPPDEPLRLAIRVSVNLPRIEIRLVKMEYTYEGRVPLMDDTFPEELAGECLSVVHLIQFPDSRIN